MSFLSALYPTCSRRQLPIDYPLVPTLDGQIVSTQESWLSGLRKAIGWVLKDF